MSDPELFESILAELAVLLNRLDYLHDAVLIGGQVIAVEQLAAGHPAVFQVETDTGQRIQRPYSMEPDLLLDPPAIEESARWDELPVTLRECGFKRSGRSFRWAKVLDGGTMELDLFVPHSHQEPVTHMTPLENGERVIGRSREVRLLVRGKELRIKLPHPADFIRMKLDNFDRTAALREERHKEKDALDLYAYIHLKTPPVIAAALQGLADAPIFERLREHFGAEQSIGVRRVLRLVPGLSPDEQRLIAKHLVRSVNAVLDGAPIRTA